MPPVVGTVKTNKLRIQGHGPITSEDLTMEVKNSTFTMSMGEEVLMTVAPDGVDNINDGSTSTPSLLTIEKDTVFLQDVTVQGDLQGPTIDSITSNLESLNSNLESINSNVESIDSLIVSGKKSIFAPDVPKQNNPGWGGYDDDQYLPSTSRFFTPDGVGCYDVFNAVQIPGWKFCQSMSIPVTDTNHVYFWVEAWPEDFKQSEIDRIAQEGRNSGAKHTFGAPDKGNNLLVKINRQTGELVKWVKIEVDLSTIGIDVLHLIDVQPPSVVEFTKQTATATRGPLYIQNGFLYTIFASSIHKYDTDLNLVKAQPLSTLDNFLENINGDPPDVLNYEIPNDDIIMNNLNNPLNVPWSPRHINVMRVQDQTWVFVSCVAVGYANEMDGGLGKFNQFYQDDSVGRVIAYIDDGTNFVHQWTHKSGPVFLQPGDKLPETSFRVENNAPVDDVQFYWIMNSNLTFTDGGAFKNGNSNTVSTKLNAATRDILLNSNCGVPKTTGVHKFIRNIPEQMPDIHIVHPLPWIYRPLWFDFTQDGEEFDVNKTYIGWTHRQINASNVNVVGNSGYSYSVSSNILGSNVRINVVNHSNTYNRYGINTNPYNTSNIIQSGVHGVYTYNSNVQCKNVYSSNVNGKNMYFSSNVEYEVNVDTIYLYGDSFEVKGSELLGCPFYKSLYKEMINRYPLSPLEASQLNHHGASYYGQMVYDDEKDVFIIGTGNAQRGPEGISRHVLSHLYGIPETDIYALRHSTLYHLNLATELGISLEQLRTSRNVRGLLDMNPEAFENAVVKYHEVSDKIWDVNYGGRQNRFLSGSIVGLARTTGHLKWAFQFTPWDYFDHNAGGVRAMFSELHPTLAYKAVPFTPAGINSSGGPGGSFLTYNNRKYLLVYSKYRSYILDYDRLDNTLTHVPGETDATDPHYYKGVANNTAMKNALVWAENAIPPCEYWTIGGKAFDGRMMVVKNNNAPVMDGYDFRTSTGSFVVPQYFHTLKYTRPIRQLQVCTGNLIQFNTLRHIDFPPDLKKYFNDVENNLTFLDPLFDPVLDSDLNPYQKDYITVENSTPFVMGYDTWKILNAVTNTDASGNFVSYKPLTYKSWQPGEPGYSWIEKGAITNYSDKISNFGLQIYGDVVVTGQDNGDIVFMDVQTGRKTHTVRIPGGAETMPAIVDGIIYQLSGSTKHSAACGSFERYDPYFTGKVITMITPFGK